MDTKLNATISADSAEFKQAIADASQALGKLSKNINEMEGNANSASSIMDRMKDTLEKLGIPVNVEQAWQMFTQAVSAAIDKINEIHEEAKTLGVSAEHFQVMTKAARQTNVPMEELKSAFETFGEKVGEAFAGEDGAIQVFEKLGVSLDELKGKTPEEQFELVNEALSMCADETTRNAAKAELLGGKYQLLNSYLDDYSNINKQIRDEGGIIDDETITQVQEIQRHWDNIKDTFIELFFESGVVQAISDIISGFQAIARYAELVKELGISWKVVLFDALEMVAAIMDNMLSAPKAIVSVLAKIPGLSEDVKKSLNNFASDTFLADSVASMRPDELNYKTGPATEMEIAKARAEMAKREEEAAAKQELIEKRRAAAAEARANRENKKLLEKQKAQEESFKNSAGGARRTREQERAEAEALRVYERQQKEREKLLLERAKLEEKLIAEQAKLEEKLAEEQANRDKQLAKETADEKIAQARRRLDATNQKMAGFGFRLDGFDIDESAATRNRRGRQRRLDASIAGKLARQQDGERVVFSRRERNRIDEMRKLENTAKEQSAEVQALEAARQQLDAAEREEQAAEKQLEAAHALQEVGHNLARLHEQQSPQKQRATMSMPSSPAHLATLPTMPALAPTPSLPYSQALSDILTAIRDLSSNTYIVK